MKNKDFTGIVPSQYTGKEIEADSLVELEDENEAKKFYNIAKEKLLQVNNWHNIAGFISAKFQVINANAQEVNRNAAKGDYIRIDIPGPGSKEGEGYDWVFIEELKEVNEEDMQSIAFRVRPAANPSGNKEHIAHFYDDSSTSSFIVTREKTKLIACIIDRNTMPNDDTESLTDKLRHTIVGMTAINSFSKVQWKHLAKGLVENK